MKVVMSKFKQLTFVYSIKIVVLLISFHSVLVVLWKFVWKTIF